MAKPFGISVEEIERLKPLLLADDVDAVKIFLSDLKTDPFSHWVQLAPLIQSLKMLKVLTWTFPFRVNPHSFSQPRLIRELVANDDKMLIMPLPRRQLPVISVETWVDVGLPFELCTPFLERTFKNCDMSDLTEICALFPSSYLATFSPFSPFGKSGFDGPALCHARLLFELGLRGSFNLNLLAKYQRDVAKREAVWKACLSWINFIG